MYVYIKSEPMLWTVGHYTPEGKWMPERDYNSPEEAAARVAWLNGGGKAAARHSKCYRTQDGRGLIPLADFDAFFITEQVIDRLLTGTWLLRARYREWHPNPNCTLDTFLNETLARAALDQLQTQLEKESK